MQNLQTNCTSGAFTLLPKYVLDVIMLLFAITEKSYNGFSIICDKSETKAMGNSRKYPYPTTDGFHVLSPPCLRKFQNALPPHALRIP